MASYVSPSASRGLAKLGVVLHKLNDHIEFVHDYVPTAFANVFGGPRLMLLPLTAAAAATAAWISGDMRSMSLPEQGFCGERPSFSQVSR